MDELNSKDLKSIQNNTWSAHSQYYNLGLELDLSTDTLTALRRYLSVTMLYSSAGYMAEERLS